MVIVPTVPVPARIAESATEIAPGTLPVTLSVPASTLPVPKVLSADSVNMPGPAFVSAP